MSRRTSIVKALATKLQTINGETPYKGRNTIITRSNNNEPEIIAYGGGDGGTFDWYCKNTVNNDGKPGGSGGGGGNCYSANPTENDLIFGPAEFTL